MTRGIDIATQDPILTELFSELDKNSKLAQEKMKFVEKQAEAVTKAMSEGHQAVWRKIEAQLVAKGKLPASYDRDQTVLHYDEGTGLISACDKKDFNPKKDFMKFLHGLMHE